MIPQHSAEAVLPGLGVRTKPATQQKPSLQVQIDRHFTSKVYTSGSNISGHAVVCTPRSTPFDDFDIVFTGVAAMRLDFVQQYPYYSIRPFMKLRMPILSTALPENKVFEAGKYYQVPFTFVVPHQLTLDACTHHCSYLAVRDQHLRLPPTVGFWEANDQAPDMAHIEYSIRSRVYRKPDSGSASIKLMEGYHMVKVLPALPEDAPLDITFRDERYTDTSTANPSLSYTATSLLFTQPIGRLHWQRFSNGNGRRDSGYSSLGIDEDASDTDCSDRRTRKKKRRNRLLVRHSTVLEIPFTIPTSNRKLFLPTFHSCLISRTYTLYVGLSVGPANTAVMLAVPLQIGVEMVHDPPYINDFPSFESAIAEDEAEADALLLPRVMRIPESPRWTVGGFLPNYDMGSRRVIAVI